jgi:hypothetical protein
MGIHKVPRLPVRAAIYVAPDGNVHFGALFADLVPVAQALGAGLRTDSTSLEAQLQIDDGLGIDETVAADPGAGGATADARGLAPIAPGS